MKKFKNARTEVERRKRQANKFARILKVLHLISREGQWNMRNLAKELKCCERTIYRDLNVLQLAGVPVNLNYETNCYQVLPFPSVKIKRFLNDKNLRTNDVRNAEDTDELFMLADNREMNLLHTLDVMPRVIFEGADGKVYEGRYEYAISQVPEEEAKEYRRE